MTKSRFPIILMVPSLSIVFLTTSHRHLQSLVRIILLPLLPHICFRSPNKQRHVLICVPTWLTRVLPSNANGKPFQGAKVLAQQEFLPRYSCSAGTTGRCPLPHHTYASMNHRRECWKACGIGYDHMKIPQS